jgi:hypothetical protein
MDSSTKQSNEAGLKVLKAARDLISVPERWTQGADARRSADDHERLHPTHPEAKLWCADGALIKAAKDNDAAYRVARKALREQTGALALVKFNDSRTHPEVLAIFDSAIAQLEANHG